MAFGVWYEHGDDAYLIDSENQKLSLDEARRRVVHALKDKEKDELLAMLVDRMDVEDLMRYVADGSERFYPDPAKEEQEHAEVMKNALSGTELAKIASTMPRPSVPWTDHPDDVRPSKDAPELDVDYEKR